MSNVPDRIYFRWSDKIDAALHDVRLAGRRGRTVTELTSVLHSGVGTTTMILRELERHGLIQQRNGGYVGTPPLPASVEEERLTDTLEQVLQRRGLSP